MLTWLRSRLTYSNVGVTLALVLATTGFAVAASIPDSRGVIHGCYKKKGGDLRVVKKAKCRKAERKLAWNQRGRRGARGPRGARGAAGAPAPRLWAVVSDTANLVRQIGATGAARGPAAQGDYRVTFNQDISACSAQATIGGPDSVTGPINNDVDATVYYVSGSPTVVGVRTTFGGSAQDQPFHLAVLC